MNSGSGGDALGSAWAANDQMWESLLALPDMDEGPFSAEGHDIPSTGEGGAGSKRQRTEAGDSDDAGDGEDGGVSSRMGVRLDINESMRRKKQRRANRARQDKAEAKLLDRAAQRNSELLNPRRLSELRSEGAVLLQTDDWIACREELLVRIAEVCEVAGRDFIYTKGLTKGKKDTATWICCEDDGLKFACACKNSNNCTFRCKVCSPCLLSHCLYFLSHFACA